MKLYIRQRLFSWTDSYDVYDETGRARYSVKTDFLAFGHQIHVFDVRTGQEVGSIHQKLLRLLPEFEILLGGRSAGSVRRQLTLLTPRYQVDYRGWRVSGNILGWDYRVTEGENTVMTISKRILQLTDTYELNYSRPEWELPGLLLVLAVDAANCEED